MDTLTIHDIYKLNNSGESAMNKLPSALGLALFIGLSGCAATPPVVLYESENVISFTSKTNNGRPRVTPEMRDLAAKHCNATGTNAVYKGGVFKNMWTNEEQHDFTCERGKVELVK